MNVANTAQVGLVLLALCMVFAHGGSKQPWLCWKGLSVGYGDRSILAWHYNAREDYCKGFHYKGSGGNANTFTSEIKCLQTCPPVGHEAKPLCSLRPEHGQCTAYLPRFYYDILTDTCKVFVYGGCGGNENRFMSCFDCMYRCSAMDNPLHICRPLQKEFERNYSTRYWESKPKAE